MEDASGMSFFLSAYRIYPPPLKQLGAILSFAFFEPKFDLIYESGAYLLSSN